MHRVMSREEVVSLIRKFLEERIEILFAYLYGSFLHADSAKDIDLAVFLRGEEQFNYLKYSLQLSREVEGLLDPRYGNVDARTLNNAPLYFQYEVIKTGNPIFVRDKGERVRFETRITIEYLDFLFILDEYNKSLSRRIELW